MKDRVQKVKLWASKNIDVLIASGVVVGVSAIALAIVKSTNGGDQPLPFMNNRWEADLPLDERQALEDAFEVMIAACKEYDKLEAELKSRHS